VGAGLRQLRGACEDEAQSAIRGSNAVHGMRRHPAVVLAVLSARAYCYRVVAVERTWCVGAGRENIHVGSGDIGALGSR